MMPLHVLSGYSRLSRVFREILGSLTHDAHTAVLLEPVQEGKVEESSGKAGADKRKKKQRHREKKKAAAKDASTAVASTAAAVTDVPEVPRAGQCLTMTGRQVHITLRAR
jgi:hypothetical protein